MAEKKKMSVAEILAAARKLDGGAAGGEAPPEPAAESTPPAEPAAETATEAPAAPAPPKPALKPGERPGVADILAMARSGSPAAKPAAAKPAAEKPKPQPKADAKKGEPKSASAAPKPAAAKSGPAAPRLDTASILSAARGGQKPGPITKAELAKQAAAKPKAAPAPKVTVPPRPEKPEYAARKPGEKTPAAAKPVAAKAGAAPDEGRRFMLFGLLFGSFLATGYSALTGTLGLWGLATARFMFPNILTEPPSQFKVGFPDEFPPGQVNEKFKAQYGVWVVNYEYQGQAEIFALSTVCTHLGCTPNWLESEQKFKCPCHGSGFYKDGINFEGPAPRPLERYAIRRAEDGQLEIDKSKKFQEEMGQWEDPGSFFPV